jgi:5-methylcytosine-specific restriction endonuclease McrA
MDVSTLCLSSSYEPVKVIGWQTAIIMLATGRAVTIEVYPDKLARSARECHQVPAIIRYVSGGWQRARRGVRFSRTNVYIRDKGLCAYCAIRVPKNRITYDHVVPRCLGGRTSWENLVLSCHSCNQKKRDRTPQQAGMPLCTKPVKPRFLPDHRVMMNYERGMPDIWRPYLHDAFFK